MADLKWGMGSWWSIREDWSGDRGEGAEGWSLRSLQTAKFMRETRLQEHLASYMGRLLNHLYENNNNLIRVLVNSIGKY